MGFAEFAEKNPLLVLISVGAAVASAAVGVAEYFNQKQIDGLRSEHQASITKMEQSYDGQMSELVSRMTRVERILGEDKERYVFDLSEVIIPASQIARVKSRYDWYGNNAIGLEISIPSEWGFNLSDKLAVRLSTPLVSVSNLAIGMQSSRSQDAGGEVVGENLRRINYAEYSADASANMKQIQIEFDKLSHVPFMDAMGNLFQSLAETPVYVWHDNDVYILQLEGQSGGTVEIPFVAFIAVEELSVDSFLEEIEVGMQLGKEMAASLLESMEVGVAEEMAGLDDLREEVLGVDSAEDLDIYADKFMNAFDNADLAALFVLDQLFRRLQLSVAANASLGSGISFKVRSFQKVLNTVYFSTQTVFSEAARFVGGSREDVFLDEEIFFVGRGRDALVIHVSVPSVGKSSENYAFVHRWFSGITIPVETSL